MTAFPVAGAHVVYEDDLYTMYDDGTEQVRFTEAEADAMAADPLYFGLVACRRLHPLSALLSDGSCGMCEYEGEVAYYAELEARGELPPASDTTNVPATVAATSLHRGRRVIRLGALFSARKTVRAGPARDRPFHPLSRTFVLVLP